MMNGRVFLGIPCVPCVPRVPPLLYSSRVEASRALSAFHGRSCSRGSAIEIGIRSLRDSLCDHSGFSGGVFGGGRRTAAQGRNLHGGVACSRERAEICCLHPTV